MTTAYGYDDGVDSGLTTALCPLAWTACPLSAEREEGIAEDALFPRPYGTALYDGTYDFMAGCMNRPTVNVTSSLRKPHYFRMMDVLRVWVWALAV